jgi:hypothetical protein
MLRNVRVASPCSADWEGMIGDDRVRYCSACNLNVYNFSAITAAEVHRLVASHEGRLCGRFYRRKDGTILTRDCPGWGAVVRRISRIAGVALSATMSLGLAVAQIPHNTASSLVQIDLHEAGISIIVRDSSGAVIPKTSVSLLNQATQSKSEGTTDEAGRLQLSNLAAGSYLLTVAHPGFKTVHELVVLSGRKSLEVPLSVDNTPNMGVVVSLDAVPLVDAGPSRIPDRIPDSDAH